MDDSKAFDVIQDNLLLAKLKAYGAGERGFALFKEYFSGDSRDSKLGTSFPSGKVLKEGFRKKVFWGQCFLFLIYASTTCFSLLHKVNFTHMWTIISYTLPTLTQ